MKKFIGLICILMIASSMYAQTWTDACVGGWINGDGDGKIKKVINTTGKLPGCANPMRKTEHLRLMMKIPTNRNRNNQSWVW